MVSGGGAVFYAALAVDCACGEEQGFNQSGLAFGAMTNNRNVADILGLIVFHMNSPCLVYVSCPKIAAGLANAKSAVYAIVFIF